MRTITILFVLWTLFYGTKSANVCTKQRCDFLKALLPFFIILCHHSQQTDWPWLLKSDFQDSLGEAVVGIFFFISGYGLEYKRASKGLCLKDLPVRLKRLFTPTLFPVLIYYSFLLTIGECQDVAANFNRLLLRSFYPLPFTWFVVVLAVLYVGFYVCARITKNKTKFLIMFLCYSLLCFETIDKVINAEWYAVRSDMAMLVGVAYKQYEEQIINFAKFYWLRYTIIILTFVVAIVYLKMGCDLPRPCRLFKMSLPYLWLFPLLVVFAYTKIYKNKVIDFFTKISYDVYLCQGIVFSVVPYKEWNFAVSFLAVCLLTVAIATFSHWAHKRVFG